MRIDAGNSRYIKKLNRLNVLGLIRRSRVISRAAIAKESRLTATTVAEITKTLLEQELILEDGASESTGGRPSVNLVINPNARYAVGCDFESDNVTTTILNFLGEQVALMRKRYELSEAQDILEAIASSINEIIASCDIPKEKILGVGISIPGLVDLVEGNIYFLTHYSMENIELRTFIEERTGLETWVVNDANSAALAECATGFGKEYDNFVSVISRQGVGAGIIINGKLFQGALGVAGEIGHLTVELNGPRCNCGNYGCLEVMAGTKAIEKRTRVRLKQNGGSSYFKENEDYDKVTLPEIIKAAEQGDSLVLEVLQHVGNYLGMGIATVINFFNPQAIVLAGDVESYFPYIEDAVQKAIEARAMKVPGKFCKLLLSRFGDDITAIGAGELVLTGYFEGRWKERKL
ncbi:MAG: ROK family protein [Clostridia bacterium]